MSQSRRLAGILAADVVGYSGMIGTDEPGTLARVRALRTDLIEPLATSHGGRLFKTTGDGFLAAFTSSVEALRCAIAIQERLSGQPDGLRLRIGVHQGEVVAEGDDLLGDGVIIAARLEPLAEPGGICISARVREDASGKMALDVEDIGTPGLKNIEQKVHVYRVRVAAAPKDALPLPEKPSLVVLPFQNMSGDPEQEYFADGVVEDITTALSRTSWLFVIARNSAFTFKGRAVDVRQVGRELGVRYVLEGSVRRSGGRVRITCQLIEAATGHHVWADRFDGELSDIFDLQDRITETVVGAVEPNLERAEIARTSTKPTESLDAYDLYLMALQQLYLLTEAGNREARRLLRQAIAMDPHFGLAKALAAMSVSLAVDQRWIERGSEEAIEGVALARSAMVDAPGDASVLRLAGYTIAFVGFDLESGRVALDRAVALNANSAQVLGANGWMRTWLGEFDFARESFTKAMRLNPLDPEMARYQTGLAQALLLGEPAEPQRALDLIQDALTAQPNSRSTLNVGIQCLVKLGRIDEARQMAQRLRAIWPETLSVLRRRFAHRPHIKDAVIALLRQAGLPE
jgi:adenylate cyclase